MKTIKITIPTSYEEVQFEHISHENIRAYFGDYDGFGIDRETAFYDLVNNMPDGPELNEPQFPNGFDDWSETHYATSVHIAKTKDIENTLAYRRIHARGTGGLFELSQQLTDEFESLNNGKEWDGEWMEELEDWLHKKDSESK